eukprot:CAMPEP_0201546628 /NCGR_PEP_ID=MMETSP0173_2-20130828/2919_1 /ASSEMBLY_ACC=CAM_ASM_000268 /TAXON_ID=218659 /ORGANISM="Vexillifera sp., Strain DIVA3 564/2" /LENGTH=600 /DNA_ID=CAMNT_0047955351 /DNA_START=648 /DNA_END=2450 /DNA_ORIENTATION=+
MSSETKETTTTNSQLPIPKIVATVAGVVGIGAALAWYFSSSSPSTSGNGWVSGEKDPTEVHLQFAVNRAVVPHDNTSSTSGSSAVAASSSSSSDDKGKSSASTSTSLLSEEKSKRREETYTLHVTIGSHYFSVTQPLGDGETTKVYFFDGPYTHQVCVYFSATQTFAFKPFLLDLHVKLEDLFRARTFREMEKSPELRKEFNIKPGESLKAWSAIEKQICASHVPKEEQTSGADQHTGNAKGRLFGQKIVYAPATQDSVEGIERPSDATAYTLAGGEEVTRVKVVDPKSDAILGEKFSNAQRKMFAKFLTWCTHMHPSVRSDVLFRTKSLPFEQLYFRYLRNEDTVYTLMKLTDLERKDAAGTYTQPAKLVPYKQVPANTPDRAFNKWLEEIKQNWNPPSKQESRANLSEIITQAEQSNDDLVLLNALLSLQEFNLQFNVDQKDTIHAKFEKLASNINRTQHKNCTRYIQVVQSTLQLQFQNQMGLNPSPQMLSQLRELIKPLRELSNLDKSYILNFWAAPAAQSAQEKADLYRQVLNGNPYLVGVWVWLGVCYADRDDLEFTWACWMIGRKLDDSYTLFESQIDPLIAKIKEEFVEYLH